MAGGLLHHPGLDGIVQAPGQEVSNLPLLTAQGRSDRIHGGQHASAHGKFSVLDLGEIGRLAGGLQGADDGADLVVPVHLFICNKKKIVFLKYMEKGTQIMDFHSDYNPFVSIVS